MNMVWFFLGLIVGALPMLLLFAAAPEAASELHNWLQDRLR